MTFPNNSVFAASGRNKQNIYLSIYLSIYLTSLLATDGKFLSQERQDFAMKETTFDTFRNSPFGQSNHEAYI